MGSAYSQEQHTLLFHIQSAVLADMLRIRGMSQIYGFTYFSIFFHPNMLTCFCVWEGGDSMWQSFLTSQTQDSSHPVAFVFAVPAVVTIQIDVSKTVC